MVEQLKKNATNLMQEEHTSNNRTRQEGTTSIGNADVPIHFLNSIEEFQALINEMRNLCLMTTRCLEERMSTQTKAMSAQVRAMAEQTKSMVEQAKAMMDKNAKTMTE